ncbi:hypothetical protein KCU83_g8608, partial [Aureobasidium melanogenum]
MAVPRDPNFWKRFSYAVHQDEEAQLNQKLTTASPKDQKPGSQAPAGKNVTPTPASAVSSGSSSSPS